VRNAILAVLASVLSVSTAHASEPAPEFPDAGGEPGTIIVTGHAEGYRQIETTSGTKTSTPLIDVPQSITVLTGKQIADQQIRSVADLVRFIPGVSAGQGEGHRDQITIRGNNSTADFFIDGLRDDVQYYRSFYNIDRVEVHKGPNAMIFGRGGGGGLLNRVTKGAVASETILAGTGSIDTFGSFYAAADVNVPVSDSGALRVNAFYEDLNNHRDAFSGERYAVNPVIGADLGSGIKLQLGYEYVKDQRVVDRGIPSAFPGTLQSPAGPVRGFRDTFFGIRGVNETDFEAHVATFRGEASLAENLKFTVHALYGDYDKVYENVFPAGPVAGTLAAPTVLIEAYRDPTERTTFIAQSNLVWEVDTGGIGHTILAGVEFTDQDSYNERINGFFNTANIAAAASRRVTVPLADPVVIPRPTFIAGPTGNSNRAVDSTVKQYSAYLQDQLALGESVDLILGVRYDRFENRVTNRFNGVEAKRIDDLWSPRAGLVVKPMRDATVYVSYSRSFLPQSGDQFVSFDANAANLKPEKFDNYEIGAKWDIAPELSATVAVFRLDRSNTRAPGPVAGTIVQTGAQRSSGLELGLTGQITSRWQTALGLASTKARITEATTAAPAGRRVAQVPRTQLSLWNRYEVTDSIGAGVGIYHQSSSFATISNATRLPRYTRIDAALFFRLTDRIDAQVNVENLTGERYFPNAHNDFNISTGAPVNARFTINARF
jgi:catecholate siderophore receptor